MPWWVAYIGIPYQDEGFGRENGCNCWGLARLVWQEQLHCELPEPLIQVRTPDDLEVFQGSRYWQEATGVPPFSLGIYRLPTGLLHAGIVIDSIDMLHSTSRMNSGVEPLRKYRPYLQGFYWPRTPFDRTQHGSDCRPSQPV